MRCWLFRVSLVIEFLLFLRVTRPYVQALFIPGSSVVIPCLIIGSSRFPRWNGNVPLTFVFYPVSPSEQFSSVAHLGIFPLCARDCPDHNWCLEVNTVEGNKALALLELHALNQVIAPCEIVAVAVPGVSGCLPSCWLGLMRLLVFSTCVMQRSRFLSCKLFVWCSLDSA